MYEPSFFFQPAKEWGLEMVDGRPKTPLLWTDGERGFVFFVPGEYTWKNAWYSKWE